MENDTFKLGRSGPTNSQIQQVSLDEFDVTVSISRWRASIAANLPHGINRPGFEKDESPPF